MCENPGGGGEGEREGEMNITFLQKKNSVEKYTSCTCTGRQPFTSFSWFIGHNEN